MTIPYSPGACACSHFTWISSYARGATSRSALRQPPHTQPVSSEMMSGRCSSPNVDQWPNAIVVSALDGRFNLTGIAAGPATVRVRMIGYNSKLVSGITGYWLVWDQLAQYVAIATTEWLDSIGIFAEPIARNFLEAKRQEWREYISQVSQWELDRYLRLY